MAAICGGSLLMNVTNSRRVVGSTAPGTPPDAGRPPTAVLSGKEARRLIQSDTLVACVAARTTTTTQMTMMPQQMQMQPMMMQQPMIVTRRGRNTTRCSGFLRLGTPLPSCRAARR